MASNPGRRTRKSNMTSQSAIAKLKELTRRPDWVGLNAGLVPIMSEDTGYTARVDFSGQGNETSGIEQAGVRVPIATDFDPAAAAGHMQEFKDTEVACADITLEPASFFPSTDFYFATPSCEAHTGASGKKREGEQQTIWGEPLDLTAERSRLLMEEVVTNTSDQLLVRGKPFKYVVVENVQEAANGKWPLFPRWVHNMENLGYHVQILNLDARFAHGKDFIAPGQSRNRIYIVCSYRGGKGLVPVPDLDKIRPPAWCPDEGTVVNARQVWKDVPSIRGVRPNLRVGEYGKQYIYCCANCSKPVEPLSLAAQDHIDQDVPMVKIKDRADAGLKPLAPASELRTRNGLAKIALPLAMEGVSTEPPPSSAFSLTVEGPGREKAPRPLSAHAPTLTTRHVDAVARPPVVDFSVSLNGGGSIDGARSTATDPANSLLAGGGHHMLGRATFVVRNNNERGQGEMSTDISEHMRALTTKGHQTVARAPGLGASTDGDIGFISPYYGNSTPVPLTSPLPTLTSVDTHALVRVRHEAAAHLKEVINRYDFSADDVPEDVYQNTELRMITPDEGGGSMGEPNGRMVIGGNKRLAMSLHGRAVVVQAIRLITEELIFTLHPELRPDNRLPEVDRILRHHQQEIVRRLEQGQSTVSLSFETGGGLFVPNAGDATTIRAQADREAASARRREQAAARRARAAGQSADLDPLLPPPASTPEPTERTAKTAAPRVAQQPTLDFGMRF